MPGLNDNLMSRGNSGRAHNTVTLESPDTVGVSELPSYKKPLTEASASIRLQPVTTKAAAYPGFRCLCAVVMATTVVKAAGGS